MTRCRLTFACLVALSLAACAQGTAERGSGYIDPETGMEAPDPKTLPDTMPFDETPVGRHGRLSLEGTVLVDEHGEPVQLRGISSMWLNWETSDYARSYGALQWMRDNWGVSLFRAAMGVKDGERAPASGGYLTNPSNMEREVDEIVQNATDLGVYVLIDWHDHFAQDSTEESKAFFRRKAEQYRDHPNVIYEVFNEPVPREWATGEEFTWSEHFKPYHEELVKTIRAEDPEGIIILGTPFWSQNVDEAAMDPVEGSNLMYTVHFYSCTHDAWLRDKVQFALDADTPVFVTEWGATDAGGGVDDPTVCDDEADRWHEFMNANYISWAAWKLDDCSEASCILKRGAPRNGAWDDEWLQGHGPYVVDKLLSPLPNGEQSGPGASDGERDAGSRDESSEPDGGRVAPRDGGKAEPEAPETLDAMAPIEVAEAGAAFGADGGDDANQEDAGKAAAKPGKDAGRAPEPDAAPVKVP